MTTPGTRSAAVLVPIVGDDADLRLLLFERTHEVMEHKGEICFPGGSIEPSDADPVAAALREAHEELGLARESVELLGRLDDVHTAVSGYVVTPVVGYLAGTPALVPDQLEVARPLYAPLAALRAPGAQTAEWREWRGVRRRFYAYHVPEGRIWGATGRILHNLLHVWAGDEEASADESNV